MGHALMEDRNGLVMDGLTSRATGRAECLAGEVMPKGAGSSATGP